MNLRQLPNAEAVAAAGAAEFVATAGEAIARRGVFRVALSGGSTPRRMHELLRTMPVEWGRVQVFFGDERCVPVDDPQSNERMARETLLNHVSVPEAHIFGMVRTLDPVADAEWYGTTLGGEPLDLIFLGLGTDGHTLSLFPGSPALEERVRWAVPAPAPVGVARRITLTYPAVEAARKRVFLVAGEEKREAQRRALSPETPIADTPAAAVARMADETLWLTDVADTGS